MIPVLEFDIKECPQCFLMENHKSHTWTPEPMYLVMCPGYQRRPRTPAAERLQRVKRRQKRQRVERFKI